MRHVVDFFSVTFGLCGLTPGQSDIPLILTGVLVCLLYGVNSTDLCGNAFFLGTLCLASP
jgi:hypothetical protein